MTGDMRVAGAHNVAGLAAPFPFVRQRGNVALIGASSAVPMGWRIAAGRLGMTQIESLREILRELRTRGFFRILLIHHPPLPGQAEARKALVDAADLKAVLQEEGAELVLHGHNHRPCSPAWNRPMDRSTSSPCPRPPRQRRAASRRAGGTSISCAAKMERGAAASPSAPMTRPRESSPPPGL
jgi:hypothetical protein